MKIPEGGKVTNVANIPDLTTPGKKDPVKVTIELPNGKVITVDIPVTVTPVKEIETPVTSTPLTPEDYTKGMKIPEGGKVTNVANIPDLTTPGKKDPVKVTIELPNGKVITVDIPVTVTPVKEIETPVTSTPLTPENYIKGMKIPEGGKVTNVANIPDLTTPGKKDPVKVTVELPNGKVITVEVPVTVTPKSQNGGGAIAQNGGSTVQIVTEYLDENGNRITSDKEGKHNPIELEGYEFSHSTTDAKGNTLHHYKKVNKPINQEQPSSPETPTSPEKPVATPVQTSYTDSKPVAVETTVANDKKELPNTGTEDKTGLASLGLLGMLSAFGLVARKKKED
ncbi:C protein alpha-antigen precursor [Streptococcus mitis]|uniref:C protein alpha-antigen n=2 Tax=Streptococcus mitis TaxID=28037 RepID=A0A3R9MQS5_STRMT|nr:C protein alpha-antigen precursor [Streptococcus mitis]